MSDFLHEAVPPMPPMSISMIEMVAEELLADLCPDALEDPTRLDLLDWVDYDLPQRGIHYSPASHGELGDRLAATDPSGDGEIEILIQPHLFDDLTYSDRRGNRARSTVAHELAHAIIHVPIMRRRLRTDVGRVLLSRVRRKDIPAFEDPEWQAWTMAGCIMAPRRSLDLMKGRKVRAVGDSFGMSDSMMRAHLKRMRLLDWFVDDSRAA